MIQIPEECYAVFFIGASGYELHDITKPIEQIIDGLKVNNKYIDDGAEGAVIVKCKTLYSIRQEAVEKFYGLSQ